MITRSVVFRNLSAALFFWFSIFGLSFAQRGEHQQMKKLNCLECHTCANPTATDRCLKPCPSLFTAQSQEKHYVGEAPDSLILDAIMDQYGAVRFNHRLHAQMAGMGKGCAQCHHYSPAGNIPPCNECHGGDVNPANLRQPGLKGAYHRQCLACHREWSHSTACVVCHLPRAGESLEKNGEDQTDIIGIPHPIITEPIKKVYYTPYETGPVVTFYHKEHIELFGLRCVDCHQEENCAYCHDLQKSANLRKTDEEIHAICSNCHGTSKCSKCHDREERPAFTHADTGWPHNRFHAKLDCRGCHPTGRRISKLDTKCATCHGGWNKANFSHSIVGLQLDENHVGVDCTECHVDKQYQNKPDCASCHDDNRDYIISPPGKKIDLAKG